MSGIIVSSTPANVTTTSTPQLQTWSFTPGHLQIDYIQGGQLPDPKTVACKFLDVLDTFWVAGLTNISYRTYVAPNPNTYNNVVASGPLYTGVNNYQPYLTNGIQGDMVLTFQNMALLPVGINTINIVFEIAGKNQSGNWQVISNYSYKVILRVYSSTAPQVTPGALSFNWVIGAQTVALLPVTISAAFWSLFLPSPLLAVGTNFNQTGAPGGIMLTGNGTASFNVVVGEAATLSAATINPVQFLLSVNYGLVTVPLTITVIQSNGLYISRAAMEFVAYKGISEANPLPFTTYFGSPYTFQLPPWVTVQPGGGSATTTATVTPVPAINLQEGVYTGSLNIIDSNQTVLGTIAITYRVVELLDNPYWNSHFAFTLDPVFLEFISLLNNIYYKLTLSAVISRFYNGEVISQSFEFKIPLFQRRQKFNIGKVVERLMGSMPDLVQEHQVPYQPAQVSLSLEALSTTDEDYSEALSIDGLKFVSGVDPGMVDGFAILDINSRPQRIYPDSYRFINMLCRMVTSAALLRNGEEVATFNIPAGIFTLKIDFRDYAVQKGDVLEFRLHHPSGFISKEYSVFPASLQNIVVVWENEYRLKSVLELSGDRSIKSEFENRDQSLYKDLVNRLAKLESEKVSKVIINTGFVLETDQATVESLCRARRAILFSAGRVLQVVPVSKSIENSNNNRDIVSFDLEFQINPDINEEVYTF